MKGYWYIPALGILSSFLATVFDLKWFILVFSLWLLWFNYHKRLGRTTVLVSLAFSLFFYTYIPELEKPSEDFISQETTLSGTIGSQINETDSKIDFVLNTYDYKLLIVFFKNDRNDTRTFKYGADCTVSGQPELPDSSRNPGQFDYQTYLLSQGITYQFVVNSLDDIECSGSTLMNTVYQLRSDLLEYVKELVSPQTAVWLNALVLGDDTQMDDDIVTLFQRWNLSHLMAISGLHVGLVVGMLYFFLVKCNLLTREKAHWTVIFFLPFYAFIAGGEPSVWRASIMVLLFLIAGKLNWKFSATDVISLVFILLIMIDPYMVYHIGFQLSFCVTFGLLLSKKWLAQTDISAFSILKISFVSQMMILPLQVSYFYTFHPLSILLNVIVVPYFTLFVIPLMFLMLVLSPVLGFVVPYADKIFVHIHDFFLSLLQTVDTTAYYPWVVGTFPLAAVIVYYVFFLLFMKKLELSKLKQAFAYGVCLTVLIMTVVLRPYFSPEGHVVMLDIGQGDAMVIELPYREGVMLIDAGAKMSFEEEKPTENVYKQIIKPYLLSRGIAEVDAVFLTHEDNDHIGSLPYMAEDMQIQNVIVSEYFTFTEPVTDSLKKADTQVSRAASGDNINIGSQTFSVVSPNRDKHSTNDNSLVLSAAIGGKDWLFTGDIGSDTEQEIINTYPGLNAEVLKVAHHGSNTSTNPAFIESLNPVYALISAGQNNMYGHPHADVIQTLESSDVRVLRTDEQGSVHYRFTKDEGTFHTYLP